MDEQLRQQYLPPGFNAMSGPERLQFFRENADNVEHSKSFTKPIDEQKKMDLKDELAIHSLKLAKVEAEKKEKLAEFKETIKGIKGDLNPVLEALKTGYESVEEDVFWIFDQDKNKAVGFTHDGEIAEERRLRPEERQTRIKTMQAVNNG